MANPFMKLLSSARRSLTQYPWAGYEGADTSGVRRRPAPTTTSSEDWHARPRVRTTLIANARDLSRNSALAAFAIRTAIAFLTDQRFRAKTPDRAYNKHLESWWCNRCLPYNHDVAGRHGWARSLQISEALRIIDGDVGWLKIAGGANRGKIQIIEGDRIFLPNNATPSGQDPQEWLNGVRVDTDTGKALAYAISRRIGPTMKQLDRIVPANRMILHGYYQYRADSVRGSSPLAQSLNGFRDCLELIDYSMAKAKIGQIFGVAITSDNDVSNMGPNAQAYTQDADGDGENDSAPRVNLPRGTFLTELDVGEKTEIIESKTPSAETMAFLKVMIQLTLQSLDVPYSFYSEDFGNYASNRGAVMKFLYMNRQKVADIKRLCTEHALWAMALAVVDGELDLPPGGTFDDLRDAFEFVQGAYPYDQPQREARSTAQEIAMAVDSPQRAAQERGVDFFDMVDDIAAAKEYAEAQGVDLTYTDSALFAPELTFGGSDTGEQ